MFSYIAVAFTGCILLISICLMLKAGKLHSIASSAILANEKKWKQLHLTLDNSNPKRDKSIIRMKHKFLQGNESSGYRI